MIQISEVTKECPHFEEPNCWFFTRSRLSKVPIFFGKVGESKYLDIAAEKLRKRYSNTERRNGSWEYNCHGLTFSQRIGWIGLLPQAKSEPAQRGEIASPVERGSDYIECLLDDSHFKLIFRDDDIERPTEITDSIDVKVGDVAIYKMYYNRSRQEIMHSGIIVDIQRIEKTDIMLGTRCVALFPQVLSKFGFGPEFIHPYCNIDTGENGSVFEIWTDRYCS